MSIGHLPAKLSPGQVLAITDSREQLPFNLTPLRSEVGTLSAGDYSLAGFTDRVALERKSLDDLIGCVGCSRERFEREIQRLRGYETRAVIVEAGWADLEKAAWRSQVTANAAIGSVCGWIASGIPFILAGSRERAEKLTVRILYTCARRFWTQARNLVRASEGAAA